MTKPKGYNLGGIFDSMEFPDYVFKEYPKAMRVKKEDGTEEEIVVSNQREELALMRNIPSDELAVDLKRDLDAKDKEIAALKSLLEASNTPSPPPSPGPKKPATSGASV